LASGFAVAAGATPAFVPALDAPAAAAIAAGLGATAAVVPAGLETGFAADTGAAAVTFVAAAGLTATGFAADDAVFAFAALASGAGALPRPRAYSTEARRSTSMRNGCPEEYSAWNITFHDWQIMRSRIIGSCAENCARRQSMV
jgi:hypothetical protein